MTGRASKSSRRCQKASGSCEQALHCKHEPHDVRCAANAGTANREANANAQADLLVTADLCKEI
jgi:hypothetical protein